MSVKWLAPVILLLITVITPSTATVSLLPVFTGYLIENTDPLVSRSVTVTVFIDIHDTEDNDQSGYWGTLTLLLYWSRDRSSWVSITMSVMDAETYQGVIPSQDGLDNRYYDQGEGWCYWFVRMRNSLNEEETLFTAQEPNGEIYFRDPFATSSTSTADVPAAQPFSIPVIDDVLKSISSNPDLQIAVVVIAGIIIFLLATGGRGFMFLRVLFRR